MAEAEFSAFRSDDSAIIDGMGAVARELALEPSQCKLIVTIARDKTVEVGLDPTPKETFVRFAREHGTSFWQTVVMNFQLPGNASVRVHREDAYRDSVKASFPNDARPDRVMRLLQALHTAFQPQNKATGIERALGSELAEFYERREAGLLRLEVLAQKLTEETQQYRVRLDEEFHQKRRQDEESFTERARQLEAAMAETETKFIEREQKLAEEKKQLDDRSSRYVRRDSVKGLKQIIQTRRGAFALTRETQKKRIPIHIIFCSLLALSALIVAAGLLASPAPDESVARFWWRVVRVPIGLTGFAATAIFYIRWNDRWFRQHADEEFRLRQLELDIDRASWMTELALEFRDEKGDLPPALLDRLGAGLFAAYQSDEVRHPSQDVLAAIFGSSTAMRFKIPGGVEAEMNRAGIRRMQDELRHRE